MISKIIQEDIETIEKNLGKDLDYFRHKRVLVTGGSGFLGSYLCDVLCDVGARVICVDNMSSGNDDNIKHLRDKNFEMICSDVSWGVVHCDPIDMIFHLASMNAPGEFRDYGVEIIKANVFGTYMMLLLAKRRQIPIFFSSTSEVYGNPTVVPTPETYWGNVDPNGVRSSYDESKRCGEALCMAFNRQYKTYVKIARIFNCYGPRQMYDDLHGKVITKMLKKVIEGQQPVIHGTGNQTRSFMYVTDCIEGIMRIMANNNTSGEVFNIGSTKEISMGDLAKEICKRCCRFGTSYEEAGFDKIGCSRRLPDITKINKILGWQSKISLDIGLDRTYRWLKEVMQNAK